jgi:hypothetical protein
MILGFLQTKGFSKSRVLVLGSLSVLVLLYLTLTAMWSHHFQVLALYIWPISLILIDFMQKQVFSEQEFEAGKLFNNQIVLALSFLFALIALLTALTGSRTYFTTVSKVPLNEIFHHHWYVAPEITALEAAFHGGAKTFARLGANEDSGFGAFIGKEWHLSCARTALYGFESEQIIQETLNCMDTKPNYVIASPVFFSLKRDAGTFNNFRAKSIEILNSKFVCTPVIGWDNAKICVRKDEVL